MSLFAQYLKEREGCEILENEFGFLAYKIQPGEECFIRDLFVIPEERGKGHASNLWAELQMLAQKEDCKCYIAQVDTLAPKATENIEIFTSKGFSIASARENRIYLHKEVKWEA